MGEVVKHLYLCRHGETDWNRERRIQGRTDIPLNEKGREQARELALFFQSEKPKADIVVTSPMSRAYETAKCVADALGLECRVDEDLTEIHTGVFTGCRLDDLKGDALWQTHLQDPWKAGYGEGGESADEVRERMQRVVERYERAIIVSHASPIRHVILNLFDMPGIHLYHLHIENAASTYITINSERAKLMYMNRG